MLNLNFNPFPTINTERLVLRQLTPDDTKAIFALRSDENVLKYTSITAPKTLDDAAAYIEKILNLQRSGEGIMWGIGLKNEGKLIGNICIWNIARENYRAEIGYSLLSAYHGKGFMQEAIKPIINYAFNTMYLHSIEAQLSPDNLASINVLERTGFVKEAHFKDNYFKDGAFSDTLIYSLLNKA
jgi:ribosomal-protein-alanine N-acetyltransferase